MNKTLNNTVNSNLGKTVTPVKRIGDPGEKDSDQKIDQALKIKEEQISNNNLRVSDFTAVKLEQLNAPTN